MVVETRLCLNNSSSMDDEVPEPEKCVDSELWHACTGSTVKMPAMNSLVYYFPQGHAEHAQFSLDNLQMMNPPPPPHVLCRLESQMLMADPETDEVFVKMRLIPIKQNPGFDHSLEEDITSHDDSPDEVFVTFAKTLTQSDANNGGSFSVPRQCAHTMFPMLNYEEVPPVQFICCTDVHGEMWSFRHIYRGLPKRHLLNGGWSKFVERKKLVAGDSIVFLKKESGEIHVGIRRMKFHGSNRSYMLSRVRSRRIRKESVIEAIRLASSGQAFEVVYYPRAGTPEYCVKAELVKKARMVYHGAQE